MMRPCLLALCLALAAWLAAAAQPTRIWATTWAASAHGPYPSGNPSAQPQLGFAIAEAAEGFQNQSLRMVVRPAIWGTATRIRLTNAFGTRPLTVTDVHVGLQWSGAAIVPETNIPVTFGGQRQVTLAPGEVRWSDAVALRYVTSRNQQWLLGRRLAVSFHVVGSSGPLTWHAKALGTSYLGKAGAPTAAALETEAEFPYSTTSWFLVDAVDMHVPADTRVVVTLGDSLTDGTASTLNGDDRWPDVLARRLQRVYGNRVAVVNAGIGGNQVAGPDVYSPTAPAAGGPAARQRIDRDVLSLSAVSTIIWLEGINDLSRSVNRTPEEIAAAMRETIAHIRAAHPAIRVVGATLPSALRATNAAYGSPEVDQARRRLNALIKAPGLFDAVVDFDAATSHPATGELKPEFVPDSTTGGAGDRLHPNRAGYLAMGEAIDLSVLNLGAPGR